MAAFRENSIIEIALASLTSGKERKFVQYIPETKKEETTLRRLEKCIL